MKAFLATISLTGLLVATSFVFLAGLAAGYLWGGLAFMAVITAGMSAILVLGLLTAGRLVRQESVDHKRAED